MRLKTQVLIVGASTIAACFGISEMLSHQRANEFSNRYEMRILKGGDNASLLAAFRQEKQALLQESVALRLLSAVGAVPSLCVAVNLLWSRNLSRPINLLRAGMNSMSRGAWMHPIPVQRQDEIGSLVGEFNLLGPKLTFAAHQYAAASKLAAMALIGQRVTRHTNLARSRLVEIQQLLSAARYGGHGVPQGALHDMGKVIEELTDLAIDLDSGFNDELVRQGLPPRLLSPAKGRALRVISG